MDDDENGPEKLASAGWPEASPTWSPDGEGVAFVKKDGRFDAGLEVFEAGADGSGSKRLTGGEESAESDSLEWSADGSKLAYRGCTGFSGTDGTPAPF